MSLLAGQTSAFEVGEVQRFLEILRAPAAIERECQGQDEEPAGDEQFGAMSRGRLAEHIPGAVPPGFQWLACEIALQVLL